MAAVMALKSNEPPVDVGSIDAEERALEIEVATAPLAEDKAPGIKALGIAVAEDRTIGIALIEVTIALGIKSAGLVTILEPLMKATGDVMIGRGPPVGTIVILPLTTEANTPPPGSIVALSDAADKASGKADLSMAGMAEARALGKFERRSARAV